MTPNFTIARIAFGTDTETKDTSFRSAIEEILSPRWKDQVQAIQQAYQTGWDSAIPKEIRGRMETIEEARIRCAKDASSSLKLQLAGYLFSGTFSRRAAAALTQHSGLICADLDGLGNTVASVKEQISADPHVLAAFFSPTGTGLKVVFRCDPSKPHAESFTALEHYVAENFGLEIDQACSDVSRICYTSHDPEAFVADDAQVLPYPPPEPVKVFEPRPIIPGADLSPGDDYDRRGIDEIPALLESHGWTHSHGLYWRRPGKTKGLSASFGYVAPGVLRVFSSAPETRLPPDKKGFGPFALITHLEHNGDWVAAARALVRRGYGATTKSRQQLTLERVAGPAPDIASPGAKLQEPLDFSRFRVRLAAPPPEPQVRLFLAGKPVCTPGNLTTLIARAKTGKTAALGAATAAIIGAHYDRQNIDTFRFSAPHTKEAVVIIDTEQSAYDAWVCHKRSLSRAASDEDPDWLMHYAMVGQSPAAIRRALPLILDHAKQQHGGVFTVILDGVADLVISVNDEVGCSELITEIRSLSISYNTPIINVIHSNEGVKSGDDGRGWLGKELTRKAESNLLLKKEGEITTITSDKQRNAPILESDGVAFRWSDEHQRHVSCGIQAPSRGKGGRPKTDIKKLIPFLPEGRDNAKPLPQIFRDTNGATGMTEKGFAGRLSDALDEGVGVYLETIPGKGPCYYR